MSTSNTTPQWGLVQSSPPIRVLDTRTATPLASMTEMTLIIGGREGDQTYTNAAAVFANITVTGSTADGFLAVWPTGFDNPGTSNVNFAAGQTVANMTLTWLGYYPSGGVYVGAVQIYNGSAGTVDVIVDVTGIVTGGMWGGG